VTAIDHSAEMMAVAQRILPPALVTRVRFECADVERFLRDAAIEPFDLVTCVGCLHHLTADQQRSTLSLIRAAVRPTGLVVLADPIALEEVGDVPPEIQSWNARSPIAATSYSPNVQAEDPDEAPIPVADYLARIAASGLRVVKQVQSWEILSHSVSPSSEEIAEVTRLYRKYPNQGNVIAFALARDAT
jgi:2-polyprenyl-3-methyl-5-hydroxy-6-metoxy-1,4-benzoquinol methylase